MYAGVEHLGRATADFVDAMLIVVEPTKRSLGTAAQIKKLAADIGIKKIWLVANKVQSRDDVEFVKVNSPDIPLLDQFYSHSDVIEADRRGVAVYDYVPSLRDATERIAAKLTEQFQMSH